MRRSPPSYMAANDCGFPGFFASACCRTSTFFRTATSIATRRAYSGDLRDFCMRRQGRESAAHNLILESDYPKTGYKKCPELSLVVRTGDANVASMFEYFVTNCCTVFQS